MVLFLKLRSIRRNKNRETFTGKPMRALNIKLLRDLWKMKGQAFAIVLVIVSGISTFVMLKSTMNSLNLTRKKFYQDYSFADVFASLKRAPDSLKDRIAA